MSTWMLLASWLTLTSFANPQAPTLVPNLPDQATCRSVGAALEQMAEETDRKASPDRSYPYVILGSWRCVEVRHPAAVAAGG